MAGESEESFYFHFFRLLVFLRCILGSGKEEQVGLMEKKEMDELKNWMDSK